MSEESNENIPDNMYAVEDPRGRIRLKTIRKGRDKKALLAMEAVLQQNTPRRKEECCFSMQIEGKAGVSHPVFMTPDTGVVTKVQVKRSPSSEESLRLIFDTAHTSLTSSFTIAIPPKASSTIEGRKLPAVILKPMTPIIVTPSKDETFWLNVIFTKGGRRDAGATSDSGEDIPARIEE